MFFRRLPKAAASAVGAATDVAVRLATAPVVAAAAATDSVAGTSLTREALNATDSVSEVAQKITRGPLAAIAASAGAFTAVAFMPVIHAYRLDLKLQASTRWKSLPQDLQDILRPHYHIDLSQVRYAENINTKHGQGITLDNEIFFSSVYRS